MSTHRETWKKAERKFAALFGCLRQVLSGSSGRSDQTCSDSNHPRLFLEVKYREVHTTRTLWEKTRALARKEKKVPVLGLFDKGKQGCLVVIHEDDLRAVLAEVAGPLEDDQLEELEGSLRRAVRWYRDDLDEEDAA